MIIAEIVTIVFLILKLTSVVAWSWLWIFSPMIIVYGAIGLFVVLWLIFLGGLGAVVKVTDKSIEWNLKRNKSKKKGDI